MKKSKSRKIFEVFNVTLMIVLAALTLYPIINQLAVSLSSNTGIPVSYTHLTLPTT